MRYRVLFSHASTQVYEDLMDPQVFDTAIEAEAFAQDIWRVQGVGCELMRETDRGWLSRKGETPTEVIRRKWAS